MYEIQHFKEGERKTGQRWCLSHYQSLSTLFSKNMKHLEFVAHLLEMAMFFNLVN
jgi:hypothetical protein